MTVDAQPVEFPDPRDFGFTVVSEEEMTTELAALVDQVRVLIDAVAHTEAGPVDLAEARAAVATATELISGVRRADAAMLRQTWPGGRVEYGTITNIVSGPTNPAAPPLELEACDGGLHGSVTLNETYQGPPGLVHGGWIAAMLDQALGVAASVAGAPGLTANLDVNYREPTPLHAPLEITARVTGTERRKVFVAGEVRHNGKVTAEGTAIMVQLDLPA
ncbi:MAG: PaaI family thioesterase [Nocardiopsaceae bacterium]|nr:PaaI family thioesterase [Nocardiopsaceae bacterium]